MLKRILIVVLILAAIAAGYWQLTAASNCTSVLSLGEDELLWLTVKLVEAAGA